uniref:Uncharacterized protein n=1 Tax=Nelumbo nucifera TaxID=4432 RepID=A0A822YZG8_NELNU|nr:TPA_asm: hypothetical protein HUJ06_006786 [Nelumbo nucifera]
MNQASQKNEDGIQSVDLYSCSNFGEENKRGADLYSCSGSGEENESGADLYIRPLRDFGEENERGAECNGDEYLKDHGSCSDLCSCSDFGEENERSAECNNDECLKDYGSCSDLCSCCQPTTLSWIQNTMAPVLPLQRCRMPKRRGTLFLGSSSFVATTIFPRTLFPPQKYG